MRDAGRQQGVYRAVFAAALCCAWGASLAQVAVEQARTLAGQTAIERAQRTGMHAGLERALKTPLEIVWLRTAAEADMWRDPTLGAAVEACVKAGAPKTGCAIVGRTAFRYVFGNTPFASAPGEVARLVVSSLNMPDTPLAAGRLSLAGNGRLYLVTPETPAGIRPTKGAVILAAGSTLQVSDALSPSILVELKAPEDEPLLLGNLAATDVGRILALLVKPATASAVEASIDARGRVALRSGGEVQLAAIVRADRPQPDAIAQPGEAPMLAALSPALTAPRAQAQRSASRRIDGSVSMSLPAIAGLERNAPRAGESMMLAALAPSYLPPAVRARSGTTRSGSTITQDMMPMAWMGSDALQRLERQEFAVATLAPGAPVPAVAARSGASPGTAPPEPAGLALTGMEAGPRPGPATHTAVLREEPVIQVAAARPVARPAASAEAASKPLAERAAEELARLRAEVEAEVAREQERLAQRAFQPRIIGAPPARRFVLGV